MTATAGIGIFYLLTWVLSFFGVSLPFLHEGSLMGIGFSLFVVAIAALNLILDFDMIEQGAALGAPKYMEPKEFNEVRDFIKTKVEELLNALK